jgi:hypothetical protein
MNHRVYGGKLGAEPGASTGQHGTSLQNCQWWELDDNDGRGQEEKKEEEEEDTFGKMWLLCMLVPCSVLGHLQKAITPLLW